MFVICLDLTDVITKIIYTVIHFIYYLIDSLFLYFYYLQYRYMLCGHDLRTSTSDYRCNKHTNVFSRRPTWENSSVRFYKTFDMILTKSARYREREFCLCFFVINPSPYFLDKFLPNWTHTIVAGKIWDGCFIEITWPYS